MNWKNGLTRLYIIGWALWLVVFAWTTLIAQVANPNVNAAIVAFIVFGIAFPAGLLRALWWAFDGLNSPGRDG